MSAAILIGLLLAAPVARGEAGAGDEATATSDAAVSTQAKSRPKAVSSRWMKVGEAERDREVDQASALPLAERLLSMSAGFLDTPYGNSPLGEGRGKDPDPMIRFDEADCLTFVEETMAMSLAASAADVSPLLQQIRYAGEPSFVERNHLMEAQWLPNNVKKGFLRDITQDLAGASVRVVNKHLTERAWTSKLAQALELPKERQLTGDFPITIVPRSAALEVAKRAPAGTVMIVVRDDRPRLPDRKSVV